MSYATAGAELNTINEDKSEHWSNYCEIDRERGRKRGNKREKKREEEQSEHEADQKTI